MTVQKVFVYGILVGRYDDARQAEVRGAKKYNGGHHATLVPDSEDVVEGEVIPCDPIRLRHFDAIESYMEDNLSRSYYWRVPIAGDVQTYVGNPGYDFAWRNFGIPETPGEAEQSFEGVTLRYL